MYLSIIIPAYQESGKIAFDISAAAIFMQGNSFEGEIIVVDDGSSDNTAEAARRIIVPSPVTLKVLSYKPHRGKGYAVRTGIKASTGKYVMFADSGCCIPYGNILEGLYMIKNGFCDIAHGSRKLLESDIQKSQSLPRRICSKFFKWFIDRLLTLPPDITDSQCGFKIYKGDLARELYSRCISDGFMFDVEVILRAQKQGCRIKEFPVEWTCDLDSRLSLTRAAWPVLRELITLKRRLAKE